MNFVLAFCFGVIAAIVLMLFSVKYYSKNAFYLSMINFLEDVKLNLSFSQNNIHELIAKESNGNYVFHHILIAYQAFLTSKEESPFISFVKSIKFLTNEEQNAIVNYFLKLGHSDLGTENKLNDGFLAYSAEKLEISKQNINKKAILIQKLAIVLGLAVTIILL